MAERAGAWYRVSSGGQDEAHQIPDVKRHCSSHGYEIPAGCEYTVHGKSAYHGEQDEDWQRVVADVAAGVISVVVLWKVDRLDRQNILHAVPMVNAVLQAGGRVEFATQPYIDLTTMPGRMAFANLCEMAHEESKTKSDRVRAARAHIAANGAVDNRVPWGFTIEGPKYARRLVPTDEAREYVPQVYARVIAGQSLAQVCRWLEAEGVAPAGIAKQDSDRGKSGQWWPRSLGQLVRNPVYAGRRVNGQGQTTHECEPLVDWATWTRAGQALDSRPKRGPVVKSNRCELSGAARCLSCGGPLYRIMTGATGRTRTPYLRCAGTGPDRKSCGAPMVRLETAQALAEAVLGNLHHPVEEITVEPGNGPELDARLAALDYERRQVALRGLSWEDEDAERDRIKAEYAQVQSVTRTADRRVVRGTGVTYGQRWARLDADGRAEWLRSGEVTVFLARGEVSGAGVTVRDGVSLVLRWYEDEADAA